MPAAEVFLKLHRVLDKKDQTLPFTPWVSRVAGRHCIDKLRRRKRELNSFVGETDLTEVPDDSTPSPLSQILRGEEHRQVREQLIRLPKKYKVPLFLRYYKRNDLRRDCAHHEPGASCGQDNDPPGERPAAPQLARPEEAPSGSGVPISPGHLTGNLSSCFSLPGISGRWPCVSMRQKPTYWMGYDASFSFQQRDTS